MAFRAGKRFRGFQETGPRPAKNPRTASDPQIGQQMTPELELIQMQ